DCADDQHFRVTADLVADVFPTPALLALDVEQLFREIGSFHCSLPCFNFVVPGLKREACLQPRCAGHPRLALLTKTWMAGTSPAMTSVVNPPILQRSPIPACPAAPLARGADRGSDFRR